jgi:hypothetical protein
MDIHEIIENWRPGRFKKFIDGIIEPFSSQRASGPIYEKFNDLLLESAWATRRVAEFDERLVAKMSGMFLETLLEMLRILKA